MGSSATTSAENFGRLVVDLDLESKIISDGVLPERPLQERGQIITGIIHQLLKKRDWKKALQLRYIDPQSRNLYDGNDQTFNELLLAAIKPKDFHIDQDRFRSSLDDTGLSLLLERAGSMVVHSVSQREDIPPPVALYFLDHIKPVIGEEAWKQDITAIGKRIMKSDPKTAFHLFRQTENRDLLEQLYQQLTADFALQHYRTIEELILTFNPPGLRHYRLELLLITAVEALEAPNAIPERFSSSSSELSKTITQMYARMKEWKINLSPEKKAKLIDLVAQTITSPWDSKLDVKDPEPRRFHRSERTEEPYDPEIVLAWAKMNREKEPVKAYKLFMKLQYDGEETIVAAQKAFEVMHPVERFESYKGEEVAIRDNHLQAVFERIPLNDYKRREILAQKLRNTAELERIAVHYASSKDSFLQTRAYELFIQAGKRFDYQVFDGLRKKLIAHDIKVAKEADWGRPHFYWLNRLDKPGYEQAMAALLKGIPGRSWVGDAYELAVKHNDVQRIQQLREQIITKNSPITSLRFFQHQGDLVGYEQCIALVSEAYGQNPEQVIKLAGPVKE